MKNFSGSRGLVGKTFGAACLLAGMTLLATLNAADFDVVVADSQATVYALNPRTGERAIIAQQDKLSCPYDVASDGKGNILVSDTGTMRIVRVSLATQQQTVLAEGPALGVPFGIDVDGRGRIFVANSSVIVCLNKGKIEPLAKGLLQVPLDVAVGPDGNLYVADAVAGVVRINLNTKRQTVLAGIGGNSLLQQPTGIAVDGNTAYVVDGGGHSVVAVDLATRIQSPVSPAAFWPHRLESHWRRTVRFWSVTRMHSNSTVGFSRLAQTGRRSQWRVAVASWSTRGGSHWCRRFSKAKRPRRIRSKSESGV